MKFLLILALLISVNAFGEVNGALTPPSLIQLSQSTQWLTLIHYKATFSGYKSAVVTPNFFISPKGKTDPLDEIKSNFRTFIDSPELACKFPSRYMFFVKHGLLESRDLLAECSTFSEYYGKQQIKSASIVYSSGFLGNPASMYGHLLLRLNSKHASGLLDNTFNFGAIVPPEDGKLTYIFQGITGGYKAQFSDEPFYHHSNVYSENELRDMWEYRLNFSDDELLLLLAHRFELKDVFYDYYFFTENCAYQLAHLIELVTGKEIVKSKYPWVLPYDVISRLAEDYPELLTDISRHFSRQQRFYEHFTQLSKAVQEDIQRFLKKETNLESILAPLNTDLKVKTIEALMDYFSFVEANNNSLTITEKEQKKQVILARFTLPKGSASWEYSQGLEPHKTQKPSMIQIKHKGFSDNTSTEVRIRANYYDELSLTGRINDASALEALDLVLDDKHQGNLKSLTLVNIRNIRSDRTDLLGDDAYSWTVSFGLQPATTTCTSCLVGNISGGWGKAISYNKIIGYGLITGQAQTHYSNTDHYYYGLELGLVAKPFQYLRMNFKYTADYSLSGGKRQEQFTSEQAFGTSTSWDVRTAFQYEENLTSSLAFGYYW